MAKQSLKERVETTANDILISKDMVNFVDVLVGMGWLYGGHIDDWRGQKYKAAERLENLMQSSPEKRMKALAIFEDWSGRKKMSSITREYHPVSRHGDCGELVITDSGDPDLEERYRRAFIRLGVSAKRRENLKEKATKKPDLLVFVNFSEQPCAECGSPIYAGDYSFVENGKSLCLTCADLDHLEFLPRGDVAMTRRAKKYSPLHAIVLKFNRRRRRQERQGLLVIGSAIEKAEEECLGDADKRALQRERGEKRRALLDQQLVIDMKNRIAAMFPGCPEEEAEDIAAHTCVRNSGRVGRSEFGRNLDEKAIRLAVIAHIRHVHTSYDQLLMKGVERASARKQITAKIDDVLSRFS